MQIRFDNRTAIVTGAAHGFGRAIAPGFVRSNPASEKQWHAYGEEGQRRLIDSITLKRLGSPQDIANGVLFLASEHAGWITGQTLSIDGGR